MMKSSYFLFSVILILLFSCKKEDDKVYPQPNIITVKDTLNCYLSTEINYDTNQTIGLVSGRCRFTNNTGWFYNPPDSIFMNNIFLNYLSSSTSYPFRSFSFYNPSSSPVNVLDSLAWDCKGSPTLPAFQKKNMRMPFLDYSYLPLDSLSVSQNTVIQHPIIYANEIRYEIYTGYGTNTPQYSHGIWNYGSSSGFTIDTNELSYAVIPLNQFYFLIEVSVIDTKIDYPLDTFKITETTMTKISKKVYPKN